MTSEDLLYQNAYDMYHILQTMKTNIYVHHMIKDYKKQVMKTQFHHTMEHIYMQFLKALNKRPEYVCTCCHHMLFCKTV